LEKGQVLIHVAGEGEGEEEVGGGTSKRELESVSGQWKRGGEIQRPESLRGVAKGGGGEPRKSPREPSIVILEVSGKQISRKGRLKDSDEEVSRYVSEKKGEDCDLRRSRREAPSRSKDGNSN